MSDFSVRSDNVDVEQIMRQIRARIREKRGVDYTEEEVRELANVKLEKFIDPKGVRSGLLEEYRKVSAPAPPAPNFAFGEETLYETHRGPIKWMRSLLRPFLKMLFNPNPLIQALHIQAELNQRNAERWAKREQLDALHYEVIHNLVVEVTRNTLEVKSLKMRLESVASRLDFDERRARALEGVVQYRPGAVPPLQPPTGQDRGRHEQRRDQGQRGSRGAGPGSRGQGPGSQGTGSQGPGSQAPGSQAPGSQAPRDQGPGTRDQGQGTRDQGLGTVDPGANALDNDGNERRARRRRRRGRRRPGEDRGPQPEARNPITEARPIADSSPTADGRPMAEAPGSGGETDGFSDSRSTAAPPETAAANTENIDHRSSHIDHRSSGIDHRTESAEGSDPAGPRPASGSEPPSEG